MCSFLEFAVESWSRNVNAVGELAIGALSGARRHGAEADAELHKTAGRKDVRAMRKSIRGHASALNRRMSSAELSSAQLSSAFDPLRFRLQAGSDGSQYDHFPLRSESNHCS